jgi:hypothetical protein
VVVTTLAGCGLDGDLDPSTASRESPTSTAISTPSTETATPSTTPSPTPTPTPTPTPVLTAETVTETEAIPFNRVQRDDASIDVGTEAVTTVGANGVKTLTYDVVLTDGVETSRTLVREEVTSAPVDQVTSVGTREPPPPPKEESRSGCDPNYGGGCVPIDSDVDCAGGSGNGPSYVKGPVTVIGSDIYDLDRDNDGIGCDS